MPRRKPHLKENGNETVTVLIEKTGKIIAAYFPPEGPQVSYTPEDPSSVGLLAGEGQEVADLEVPDEDFPAESGPDFLEMLQRHKDQGGYR